MVGCPPSGFARWQLSLCEVRHQPGRARPSRSARPSPPRIASLAEFAIRTAKPVAVVPRLSHHVAQEWHRYAVGTDGRPLTFAIRGIGNDRGHLQIPGFGEASGGVVFRMFLREPARNRRSSGRNRKLSSDHLAATLSIRISPRANRSAWPHRNRTPVQIGNSAAWLSRSEVPTGKRSRLGQPNPHPKIVKLGNKSGHFLTAMKQGLDTTTTTHKRYLNKTTRSAVHKRSDAPRK